MRRCYATPAIVNFFDLCAVSLPLPRRALPVGLMLIARNGQDRRLLRIAAAAMQLFAQLSDRRLPRRVYHFDGA